MSHKGWTLWSRDVEEKRTLAASSTEDFLIGRWSLVFCLLARVRHQKACWKLCVCQQNMSFLNWRSWGCKPAFMFAAAAAKSLQSCPTLCDPIDGSPPGSPVPGILQARTLEWVAISFSKVWKWKVKVKTFSHIWLLATPWTAAYQAPLSMRFSR